VSDRFSDPKSQGPGGQMPAQMLENKGNRLSSSQIESACEELHGQGQDVTNAAVRAALGGGSFRDIAPAVRAWKVSRLGGELGAQGQVPGPAGQTAPEGDLGHLPAFLRDPYRDLTAQMEGFVDLVKAQFAEMEAQAREQSRATQELHRMSIADLQAKADERVRKLRAELEDATSVSQEVEAEARQIEAEAARLSRLHEEMKAANGLLASEHAVLRDLHGKAEATNSGLREQITRLEDRYHGAVTRAAQAEERCRGLEQELERVTGEWEADRAAFVARHEQAERGFTERISHMLEEHEAGVKLIEANHAVETAAKDDRIAVLAGEIERFRVGDAEQRDRLSAVQEAHIAEIGRLNDRIAVLQEEVKTLLRQRRQENEHTEMIPQSRAESIKGVSV
jgi:DNA repair exonuclease SbcCD ATPase subunit